MEEENKSQEKNEASASNTEQTAADQPVSAQPNQSAGEPSRDARMWAMFCHLAGLAGLVVPAIGCVVGPLIIWQIKKEDFPFADEQGKEAVNFQISMLIYALVAAATICIGIGIVLLPVVGVVDIVFVIIASIKANNGHHYRYPLTIRFIK